MYKILGGKKNIYIIKRVHSLINVRCICANVIDIFCMRSFNQLRDIALIYLLIMNSMYFIDRKNF